MNIRADRWDRRQFLRSAAFAGIALVGPQPEHALAEPPPETTRIRLARIPGICQSPQYIAEDLLRAEGFSEVHYLPTTAGTDGIEKALANGQVDINGHFAAPVIVRIEAGDPIVVLAGEHVGCFELFGSPRVRAIRDLKGKTVAVPEKDSARYLFLASMTAHVGLRLQKDVNVVSHPRGESIRLLSEEKIDGYLGFPPEPEELRAKNIGHVIVSSTVDRPWSQYFCCMLVGNREFVRKNPVATKRAMRAIVKAANICALEPAKVARFLVDRHFTSDYEFALRTLKSLPYGRWQDFDAEDTLRFYALRLHEAGLIRSSPQKILAQGTDWRFLNELKKELKG
jgi:NitT/TauT family transport system substrate-binding protein